MKHNERNALCRSDKHPDSVYVHSSIFVIKQLTYNIFIIYRKR